MARAAIGAVSLLVAIFLGGGAILLFGSVRGTEICPETLERRYFHFREIPILRLQVGGAWYISQTGSLEQHLVNNNLINAAPPKKTWHIIQVTRGVSSTRNFDPEILVRYLEARDSNGELYWLEWTKKQPKLAAHLWQGVCDLALAGEYTTIPDLFEVAQSATDPDKAQAEIKRLVQQVTQPAAASKTPATPTEKPE